MTAQTTCEYYIETFERNIDPVHPNDLFTACTPLEFTIEISNSDTVPSEPVLLSLSFNPSTFLLDAVEDGGFATVTTPSAIFGGSLVDRSQIITIPAESLVIIHFKALIPLSNFDNDKVDIFLTSAPFLAGSSCDTETSSISLYPDFPKIINIDGGDFDLSDVATDAFGGTWNRLRAVPITGPLDIPNQNAIIYGTMHVDIPYNFTANSNIFLGGNAKIVVDGNAAPLVFSNAKLGGCTSMWDAIEVSNGGHLTITQSEVEDGKEAVRASGNANLTIKGSTFRNNNIGLSVPGSGPTNLTVSSFAGNKFLYTGAMKYPLESQLKPRAGVEINNIASAISLDGTPGAGFNLYENLFNGIVAKGTTLTVRNSTFKDIVEISGAVGAPFTGRAIHVENSTTDRKLTQSGYGAGGAASFDDCTYGIFSIGTNLDVKDNNMVDMGTGLEIRSSQNKNLSITDNSISAGVAGINLYQNTRVNSAIIEDNHITMNDPVNGALSNATGIRADENSTQAALGLNYKIISNTVSLANGRRGIVLNNAALATIRDNTVFNDLAPIDESKGIEVTGAPNTTIACNALLSNDIVTDTWGLHVKGSFRTIARCNVADGSRLGLNFWDHCENSSIRGNQMSGSYNGFLLGGGSSFGDDAWIGQQDYHGNLWSGSFSGPAAKRIGGDPTMSLVNRFLIDPNHPQYSQQHPLSVDPSVGWFADQAPTTQNTFACSNNTCPEGVGDPDFIGPFETEVAAGNGSGAGYCVDAADWTAKRHLYARLQADPSMAAGNLLMQNFLSQQANTNVGAFYGIQSQTEALLTPTTNQMNQLEANRAGVDTKTASIESIDAQLLAGGLTQQQVEQLVVQQTQLRQEIATLQQQSDAVTGSIASQKSATATSIRQANNAISANAVYEQNQQQVNDIFLQTIAVGSTEFTTTQLSTLLSIANQCALCGGDAVYQARSMYGIADPNIRFEDAAICAGIQPLKKPSDEAEAGLSITISPNPASYWALLKADNKTILEGQVELFDVSGKLVQSVKLELEVGEPYLLDFSNLPVGFYSCKVLKDGRSVFTEKVIITR